MQKHKIIAFLLALIVSIGLWVYAVTVVNPDDTVYIRDVRVRIIGESALTSDGLMLTGGANQTVNIEFSGRRSDLKELNSSTVEATADVSNIDSAGSHPVSWKIGLPSTVASGDVRIVSASSTTITVTVSEYKERPEIPLDVVFEGTLPDGYIRDPKEPFILDQSAVAVSGPAEEVSKIAKAVVSVNQDGAKDTIDEEMEYAFVDQNGKQLELSEYVSVADPTVRVTVPIYPYKQVPLKVELISGGGVTESNVDLTIDPPAIDVYGPEETLKNLNEIVLTSINLADMEDGQTLTVTPELPSGVKNRASENTVKIKISFVDIQTETFTIPSTDIVRENDIANMAFLEQSVTITVRGTKAAIAAIRAENIKVYADMTNGYDAATKSVTLRIELPKNTTAGVVGGPYLMAVTEY